MQGPDYSDTSDFESADRGFIASLQSSKITASNGKRVWDNEQFGFLRDAKCPASVNPSLWRQSQLCFKEGLFRVVDGIYQVRGLDLSNMTLVEGQRGVIVIDPLISVECAAAALGLYRAHRGARPVTGLIYTHSHGDHFGGARGVLQDGESTVPILAPEGFLEHAVSENIYAGPAMTRRASYMYGINLPRTPDGNVGVGLGLDTSSGAVSLVPPTIDIKATGQEEVVDGVHIIFQVTPGTEAPAEMNFYFPDHRALCMAENATHNIHNLLTLRGALVRDAHAWSSYLDEAISLFADDSEVLFASHHWPTWGKDAIRRFLSEQRDVYAYLHDQTLRMMNQGLTGIEIAEEMVLPRTLQRAWHVQGYYGSVSHNVKAIYQRYLGWFDGNPAHLWEHPPVQAAKRYVSCMGGADEVVTKAEAFARDGDLRFAVTLLNHAVFADPDHTKARQVLASIYDQLGHGAENGPWRNFYLTGAQELRSGTQKPGIDLGSEEAMRGLTVAQLLDSLAIRLDGPRAQDFSFKIDLHLVDVRQHWRLTLSNGALTHNRARSQQGYAEPADLTCELAKSELPKLVAGKVDLESVVKRGDPTLLARLFSLLSAPNVAFNIVVP